jgi:WD40 repeat protein
MRWEIPSGREAERTAVPYREGWRARSPDGVHAVISCGPKDDPDEGNLRYIDVHSGVQIRAFQGGARKYWNQVCFSPDGRYLAGCCGRMSRGTMDRSGLRVWDVSRSEPILSDTPDGEMNAITFTPDSKYLLTGQGWAGDHASRKLPRGALRIWSMETGQAIHTAERTVFRMALAPSGRYFATIESGQLDLWEIDWDWSFDG